MKRKSIIIPLIIVLIIVFGAVVAFGGYVLNMYNSVSGVTLDDTDLEINEEIEYETDIINIALFGLDGRYEENGEASEDVERSDTIMILTLDFENDELKITSILRDTYVQIPESEYSDSYYTKINAAYMLGGPELAVKTINQNFDMNITDYICVDFTSVVEIVDAVGGVDIVINHEEQLYWTNQYVGEVNRVLGTDSAYIDSIGLRHLDGVQALAYARNRYSDNGDFSRTERQREVLEQAVSKVFDLGLTDAITLINDLLPYVETSLDINEMISYATSAFAMEDHSIQQLSLLDTEYYWGGLIGELWYAVPNTLEDNVIILHEFIYGDSFYSPSSTVQEISNQISYNRSNSGTAAASDDYGAETEEVYEEVIEEDTEEVIEEDTEEVIEEDTEEDTEEVIEEDPGTEENPETEESGSEESGDTGV
jgi:LCP family protein required for cell wall assembly